MRPSIPPQLNKCLTECNQQSNIDPVDDINDYWESGAQGCCDEYCAYIDYDTYSQCLNFIEGIEDINDSLARVRGF